ncbi:hypothetical protein COT30_04415 [Candidatus Micrarchaeota archaeon CG08_land_8_20_14_0_20_49_17]|nr:MAG: hypothetical protein AUJ13_01600 [Candidatus Micrarchaeota archaeon CG1_02_49_24]PIU09437.1 MAG: hypothetical protein COT30_04415 [Candidatus Micrarchaeota archaeon CG08_land_8_20_14_0_20_49_17]PIU81550.1 MAG: hypothetical protein COS70_03510 [Candidatus Micrarchaeota archaeon CG06_land_8_20_14_3_00_50_6]PIZ92616.1 MAG: hypothetical protein COX84_06560 [Candidatus Micrarchaeota archaeon CG_4_10_14_0_2_um_filter_49_7]
MKAYRIIVSGNVQKVGYRNLVAKAAAELDINGCVRNLADKTVEIVAEHESEGVLNQFVEKIKVRWGLIRVQKVGIESVPASGHETFEIVRGDALNEILESMDFGATYLSSMDGKLDKIDGKLDKIDGRLGSMDGKLDNMGGQLSNIDGKLDKIDGKLDKIDGRLGSMDGKLDDINEGVNGVNTSITDLSVDLRTYLEPKFQRLEKEIEKIKIKLHMA